MIKKVSGSEAMKCVNQKTGKRGLTGESAAEVVASGDGSLEQIFYFLSELDLDSARKGKGKPNAGYEAANVPEPIDDVLEEEEGGNA